MPQHWTLFVVLCSLDQSGTIRVLIAMARTRCRPDARCVKTRRIGSRSNLEPHACLLLRALPALSYEPAIRRAKPFVSV